jgi:farnesyl-diphosphate farnesyltransferase
MIAYLLFRIADTFEDAAHWPPERRIEALGEFHDPLRDFSSEKANRLAGKWTAAGVSPHAGYRQLIAETPSVLDAFFALDAEAVTSVRDHVCRSAEGMAGFVARAKDGVLVLDDLQALRDYCYAVAGIVGEMLSDLFLLKREILLPVAPYLRERAATFGEALQLVNILKDAAVDVTEGRSFLPRGVARSEIFALARRDLLVAAEYTLALQRAGAPRGLVEFCALRRSSPGRPSESRRAAPAPGLPPRALRHPQAPRDRPRPRRPCVTSSRRRLEGGRTESVPAAR